jgi:uncharacterized membrane protein
VKRCEKDKGVTVRGNDLARLARPFSPSGSRSRLLTDHHESCILLVCRHVRAIWWAALVLGVADRVQRESEAVAGRSGGRAPALATSQQTWALAATGLIASAMSFTLPIAWLTTTDGLIWAAGSGILNYALPFGLYLAALRHLHVSTAAGYLSLIPVMGLAGSFLFLGEQPTAIQLLGAAVVAASLFWLARMESQAPARSTGSSLFPRPPTGTDVQPASA